MLLTEAVKTPTFANHESFHPRYGWLKKAYDQTVLDSGVFVREDATVKLGVGKNMVRAIRFWGIAGKVIESSKMKKGAVSPSGMGDLIFDSKSGLDPYMEKPDTMWLLHWNLFAPPCSVPVWWIILNDFSATNVNLEEMTDSIISRITNMAEWKTPSSKSIKKDVDVFVHTYTTRQGKLSMEDYVDCPFRQLRMINQSSRESMRFVFGKKYGMSPLITAYACLDFIKKSGIHSKSVSVSRLATEAGGVGRIFKINEHDLLDLLTEAASLTRVIKIETVNSSPHLISNTKDMSQILELLYEKNIKKNSNQTITPKISTLTRKYKKRGTR